MAHLTELIEAAYSADRAFEAALKAAGFKTRWHWHISSGAPSSVASAYHAKVAADTAMHRAFELSRKEG